MHRRDFLSTGAGTAVALAVAAKAAPAHGAEWLEGTPPAAGLTRARFAAWLHSGFRVRPVGGLRSGRATLIEVADGPRAAGLDQFHLIFRSDGRVPTGLCELRHDSGATLHLWLDEGRRDGAAALTRATFSLIATA
jgi:hypothetical protein